MTYPNEAKRSEGRLAGRFADNCNQIKNLGNCLHKTYYGSFVAKLGLEEVAAFQIFDWKFNSLASQVC